VWLTLPVERSGLQDNALSVIASMLRDGVSIAGVNVMAVDFAQPPAAGSSMLQSVRDTLRATHAGSAMLQSVEDALQATHAQLAALLRRYGIRLGSAQIWQRLGATVMVGQNDIQGENFSTADAQGLVRFAAANHLGRISMSSLNRDRQCGSSFPENGMLSDACSGAVQSSLEFSQIFGQLRGVSPVTAPVGTVQPDAANTNPADAPYPQWSATGAYPSGYKIVEDGEIYESKWYNSGDDPQAQVQYPWQTPWELVGPVLPGDHAPDIARLPRGTYPAWSRSVEYRAGDKVLYLGLPYEAKWDNQGVFPQSGISAPAGSPWQPLYKIPGEPAVPSMAEPTP
jgi:chitinase